MLCGIYGASRKFASLLNATGVGGGICLRAEQTVLHSWLACCQVNLLGHLRSVAFEKRQSVAVGVYPFRSSLFYRGVRLGDAIQANVVLHKAPIIDACHWIKTKSLPVLGN